MKTSGGVDRSIDLARRYIDDAVEALAPFAGTPSAAALAGAATHLLDRRRGGPGRMSAPEGSDVTTEVASLLSDLSDVWAAQAQRWYDRAKAKDADLVPEDAVSETIDLVEHLAPLVERGVALTIDLLRPLAVALQQQPPQEPGADG